MLLASIIYVEFGFIFISAGLFKFLDSRKNSLSFAMGMMNPEDTDPSALYFGIQGTLDKWHNDEGWLSLFDWVGDPNDSTYKIEQDLNKQMEAFITGISLTEDFSFSLPPKPRPKRKDTKDKEKDKENEKQPHKPDSGDDDPDFEWL